MLPTKPFAVGRTAEVYEWTPGCVLKLYRAEFPREYVDYEAWIAHTVYRAGVESPKPGGIVDINGRRGIVYERVDGPSMLKMLLKHPHRVTVYGRMLADLHLKTHAAHAARLPLRRARLEGGIQQAPGLPDDLRRRLLEQLAALPDGDHLLHGDFHPDNVLLTPRGPVIIDWVDASCGHPAMDVARTRVLLSAGTPLQRNPLVILIIQLIRRLFYRAYLETYRRHSPEVVRLSDAFIPIVAAARLNEGIVPEHATLMKLAEGQIKL